MAKVGNCFAHGSTLREAMESANAKALLEEPVENRIKRFCIEFPDFDKKIPAMELFKWHHILTGSCEQGRRSFVYNHGINLDTDVFTVKEFVALTRNDYGGEIISQINK